MQVTLLSRTRGDRAGQGARMAVARRQNLMQKQRPHIIFITIVVVILMILHNCRRQAQQRKRLVCELKAVERELKAVEVFTQLIFLATFWFHIILLFNVLRSGLLHHDLFQARRKGVNLCPDVC